MITVTKAFFPPLEKYQQQLQRIWNNQWLTNRGELVLELEENLKNYLQVPHVLCTNNGTVPLQIALKLMGNGGEIITTPFSYVATTSAIVWEHCTPVFVDIHPTYLTIDETKIEAAITANTTAILATHVFGNPCNIEVIEAIAQKHQLKVIYDAAHCFGVTYKNTSIFNFGDISTCSFHATKLFHTGEGGALFCNNKNFELQSFYSHNFGHNGPLDFYGVGINGKLSELQAAMGLSVLPFINTIIEARKTVVAYYQKHLNFNKLSTLQIREHTQWNYSYFPILLKDEVTLLTVQEALNKANIYPRRYFYPSLNTLSFIKSIAMPISESVAARILCLPLYDTLSENELEQIVTIINKII